MCPLCHPRPVRRIIRLQPLSGMGQTATGGRTMAVTEEQARDTAASGPPPASGGADVEWHRLTQEAVAQKLQVDPARGLSAAEAQQRLQKYGPNALAGKQKESGWQAFLRQYRDFM